MRNPSDRAEDHRRSVFIEVTNTLAVDYLTGFQRHTRELLRRLPGDAHDGPLRFIPVIWCEQCDGFRRLDGTEERRLERFEPPRQSATSGVERVARRLGPAGDLFRRFANAQLVLSARNRLATERRRLSHPSSHAALRVDVWPPDSWLFDLEAAWHNRERDYVLPQLREEGVRTATLVADVMPVQFPQWFDEGQIRLFRGFIDAHVRWSEKFIAISECSRRDVLGYAAKVAPDRQLDTSVITMGADFADHRSPPDRPPSAPAGRYALCVATIEPRKNHGLLIDAFDQTATSHDDFSVVMVGKRGWMTEELIDRITNHPEHGRRLRWLDAVGDDELEALYSHAFIAVQPAFYEGFGTPVIEALGHGVPTLSSNGGALTEAGGDDAEYFDPTDVGELVALIATHLDDEAHHARKREQLINYRPPTWEDGAAGIVAAFTQGL